MFKFFISSVMLGLTLFFTSALSFAGTECNLTVLTSPVPQGGLKWNFLEYPELTLNDCMNTCKSKEILSAQMEPDEFLISCRMTYVAADGIITKARYRFTRWIR